MICKTKVNIFFLEKDEGKKSRDDDTSMNSVSTEILAKILEEKVKEKLSQRHCSTCSCDNNMDPPNADQTETESSDKRTRAKCSKRLTTKNSDSLLSESELTTYFDNAVSIPDCVDNGLKLTTAKSRLCSVRLQEGSKNILLDNVAAPYSNPVLYKSRSSSSEYDEPLVHSQKLTDRNVHATEHTRILISDEEII